MSEPALLGVDWGTSAFRAFLIDAQGTVLARRCAPAGIATVPPGGFEIRLRELVGDWLDHHRALPVLLSGMVTSRQGWLEVPYRPCPAGAEDLARSLASLELADRRTVHLVPGLSTRRADGSFDVLRGEEAQIVGALAERPDTRTLVLPGTHSKWVTVERGVVRGFATFMTGELYAVLLAHSILGRLAGDSTGEDEAGFERGVVAGLAPETSRGGSLARLFSARAAVLAGELAPSAVRSYLSGLLIGSELREAAQLVEERGPVLVVGEAALTERYARALALAGRLVARAPADAAARGQLRIATLAGLTGDRR